MFYAVIRLIVGVCVLQIPAAACAQSYEESAVKSWIITQLELMVHPQQSLRVDPLTFADVWAALPTTREHREKNTVRIFDKSSGAASYVIFEDSKPSLDIDRVNSEPDAKEEVNRILFRLIREAAGPVPGAENLIQKFNPTSAIGAEYCVREASNIARSLDEGAVGWRCAKRGDELQVDVFPTCAAATAPQKCLVVQIDAGWPQRIR